MFNTSAKFHDQLAAANRLTMKTSNLTCDLFDIHLDQANVTLTDKIIACFLNSVFSIGTCIGNSIILYVIWKTQELHSPSFVLLFCLAASDLLVGLICQPSFVGLRIAELGNDSNVYCTLAIIHVISSWTMSGASLLTLSAVSIDRLLAVTLHLRYSTIVTIPRVIHTVVCLWVFSISVVMLKFWITNWLVFPLMITLITFVVTTLSTLKIFQIVRRHQRQITQQQRSVQNNTINVLKCRKSAMTVLYVYGLFVIFYLPVFVIMLIQTFTGITKTTMTAFNYVATAVFFNSFLNPVVYCWRIREIRRAVKNVFRMNQNEVTPLESTTMSR